MKGNFHVQFLGEGVAATSPPYPTPTERSAGGNIDCLVSVGDQCRGSGPRLTNPTWAGYTRRNHCPVIASSGYRVAYRANGNLTSLNPIPLK